MGGVVGGWHWSVGSVADGWHRWVLGEMEWWVREGMVGGDFLNFFVLGISRNGVYRLRPKKKNLRNHCQPFKRQPSKPPPKIQKTTTNYQKNNHQPPKKQPPTTQNSILERQKDPQN